MSGGEILRALVNSRCGAGLVWRGLRWPDRSLRYEDAVICGRCGAEQGKPHEGECASLLAHADAMERMERLRDEAHRIMRIEDRDERLRQWASARAEEGSDMTYREMAIDAGARGEDEIRQMAAMIEADHERSMYDARAAEAEANAEAEAEARARAEGGS